MYCKTSLFCFYMFSVFLVLIVMLPRTTSVIANHREFGACDGTLEAAAWEES